MTNVKKEIMETLSMMISEMGYTPKVVVHKKNNVSYEGLTYTLESKGYRVPIINLDYLTEQYQNGKMSMGKIVDYAVKLMKINTNIYYESFMELICDWEAAKKNLRIYVCSAENAEKNALIFRQVEDLAIVPRLKQTFEDEASNQTTYAFVTKEMCHAWNVTEEECIEAAILCTEKYEEPGFVNILNLSFLLGEEKVEPLFQPSFKECAYTSLVPLTNKNLQYGATVIFYHNLLEKVYEYLDEEPFYIIPSSVHEVLICSMNRLKTSIEELKDIVVSINRNERVMAKEEILTDSVYCYDGTALKKLL